MTWGEARSVVQTDQTRVRSADIDLVRVLGIAAIVAGHVWTTGLPSDFLYAWHVPIFFILTGYLWTPGRSFGSEVSKRTRALLVPYGFWLLIVASIFAAVQVLRGLPFPVQQIRNALYGGTFAVRPFSAFWFVTVLFLVAILYRVLEKLPAWAPWVIAGGGIAFVHAFGSTMAASPLSAALAFPCLTFVLVGVQFKRLIPRVPVPAVLGGLLVVLGGAAVLSGLIRPMDMKIGDFGTPVVSLLNAVGMSAGFILIARAVIAFLSPQWQRSITALAVVGFVVVLSHAVVLAILETPSSGRWTDFGVALAAPWLLGLLIARTRLRRILVG